MPRLIRLRQRRRQPGWSNGQEGVDFVRCRICGERRRVISGRHLSKHGIERETYITEYHLSPDDLIAKDVRILQSEHPAFDAHSKREWLHAIKNWHRQNGSVGRLQRTHPHLYNQGCWFFGNWNNALCAAGFDPAKARLRNYWSDETFVAKIQQLRATQKPLYACYVMKHDPNLFRGALTRYGSWSRALISAGVPKAEIFTTPGQNRSVALRALRDFLKAEPTDEIPKVMKLRATYFYGSLGKAIAAMKQPAGVWHEWSQQKVITALRRLHRLKQLRYSNARRNHSALFSAAEGHLGSWGKALFAAGIDPNLYFVRHKWRQPKQTARPIMGNR